MTDREFRPKTIAMQEFEHEHGRDIYDLLNDAYLELGTQEKVGERFGLDQSTVQRWMKDLGIRANRVGRRKAVA